MLSWTEFKAKTLWATGVTYRSSGFTHISANATTSTALGYSETTYSSFTLWTNTEGSGSSGGTTSMDVWVDGAPRRTAWGGPTFAAIITRSEAGFSTSFTIIENTLGAGVPVIKTYQSNRLSAVAVSTSTSTQVYDQRVTTTKTRSVSQYSLMGTALVLSTVSVTQSYLTSAVKTGSTSLSALTTVNRTVTHTSFVESGVAIRAEGSTVQEWFFGITALPTSSHGYGSTLITGPDSTDTGSTAWPLASFVAQTFWQNVPFDTVPQTFFKVSEGGVTANSLPQTRTNFYTSVWRTIASSLYSNTVVGTYAELVTHTAASTVAITGRLPQDTTTVEVMTFSISMVSVTMGVRLELPVCGLVVDPETTSATIASSSIAAATVITTVAAHGFSSGDTVVIAGHTGSTPAINGSRVVTVVRTVDLSLRFTAKTVGKFDEDPAMASLAVFVKSGSDASTIFKGSCNFITTGLNALLGINPPTTSDDYVQAELMAEFSWGGADPGKVNWIPFFVRNDLYKTGEGAPATTGGANGETVIVAGASSVSVLFPTALASAGWHFLGAPMVINTVDGAPLSLFATTITARSANGFTVGLSGATDTGNYKLGWVVAL